MISEKFQTVISSLNEAQLQAVSTTEGPVMVVAGPGTGKTQILAARIGNILLHTDTPPHAILCLTYTESGAIAMRRRLADFIGPAAHRVHIHTFHGFCNMVIQENRHLFGNWDLQPISDLEKVQLFKEHINAFDKDHLLKRFAADAYFEKGRMQNLFDMMKKEDWSPELICRKADSYIAELPLRDEYVYKKANTSKGIKIGDAKQAAIDEEVEKINKLKAAANEYLPFEKRMKANNRYDFNDMILWVLQAFTTHPNLLLRYQEQFLYMLVDEYQDTSGAQNELLYKLADFWDEPNLFVVGDDDQSIYKFQGANIENILQFKEKYPTTLVIPLTENYRSTQPILTAAQQLIENNQDRLVGQIDNLSKDLVCVNTQLVGITASPIITEYNNDVEELAHIGHQIMERQQLGEPVSEIAIIYRSHKQAEGLIKFLQQQGVPVNAQKKINILEEPLIIQLINILSYINAELRLPNSGEHMLFHIFHYNLYNIHPLKIALLSAGIHKTNTERRKAPLTWREAVKESQSYTPLNLFSTDNDDLTEIARVAATLERCIKEATNRTLPSLVEFVINECGLLAFAVQSADKAWQMQALATFFDTVQAEAQRNAKITLHEFVNTLQTMVDEKISINLNKIIGNSEGVNFITAHSAKGLEYNTVYLLGCNADRWERSRNPNNNYKLPDTLVAQSKDNTEEDRRLFYVAMTRAKRNLHISYHTSREGKGAEESRFVTEVKQAIGQEKPEKLSTPITKLILAYEEQVLRLHDEVTIALPTKAYIDQLLESFRLSPTSLSKYLKCPVSFYYTQLIRVPSAMNEYSAFGNAVHATLDWLFRELKNRNNEFPSKDELLSNFYFQMKRLEADFTEEQYKRRVAYGEKILPAYYENNISTWNRAVVTEHNFRNIEIAGIPVKGKLDKIEFEGSTNAIVVDYKTGKYANAINKLKKPRPDGDPNKFEDVHGGDYWRQAVFYKLLIDNYHQKSWKVQSARFDFVEPDAKSGQYYSEPVYITPEDERLVKEQIAQSWERIQAHDFSKGCNDKDCEWCSFVKSLPEEFSKKVVVEEVDE